MVAQQVSILVRQAQKMAILQRFMRNLEVVIVALVVRMVLLPH